MKIISLFILLCVYQSAFSKDNLLFGIGTEFEHRIGFSDFKNLPEVPNCCPEFNGYELNNFAFNSEIEWNNGIWGTMLNINYKELSSNFKSFQEDLINIEGTAIKGVYNHQMDFDYNLFSASIIFKYIYQDVHFSSGLAFAFYNDINVYQAEKIVEPADKGVFNDTKTRTRNEWKGSYEINSISPSIIGKIEIPLKANSSGTLFFVPFLKVQYGFQIADELNWKENIFALGFYFKYDFLTNGDEKTPKAETIKNENMEEAKPIAYHLSIINKSKERFTNQLEFLCTEIEESKYTIFDNKLKLEEKSKQNICKAQFEELKIHFDELTVNEIKDINLSLSRNLENKITYTLSGYKLTIMANDFDYKLNQNDSLIAEMISKNGKTKIFKLGFQESILNNPAKEIHKYYLNTASENEILLIKNEIIEKISNKKSALLITNNYNFGLNLAKEIDSPKIQLKLMDPIEQNTNKAQYQIHLEFEK